MSKQTFLRDTFEYLYGAEAGHQTAEELLKRLERFRRETQRSFHKIDPPFSQQDMVLITYGDLLKREGELPLETLADFLDEWISGLINTVHVLPFYPYSSDDGFSVIDYQAVDPNLGDWDSIAELKRRGFRLMVDAVVNHISAESEWFQGFLRGEQKYQDYFITVDLTPDIEQQLKEVVRPRALPLLTDVETASGPKKVWTTFSTDQIDLNFANPDVLLDVIDLLLLYIEHGADIIRLDAIAFLWKEIGTTCIHLPQTHAIIQLMRAVVDEVAPGVILISETNVPHEENLSYFGDGLNEAHMVYNFSLPPLVASALLTGSSRHLNRWAASLKTPSHLTTFFNFTASHDGVGMRPATGILSQEEFDALVEQAHISGGDVSHKANSDGSSSPYELNVTYFDLVNAAVNGDSLDLEVARFLVSQAIMLALAGVPGIYIHSLLGSRNYKDGVKRTGIRRTINREKLNVDSVTSLLEAQDSLRHAVYRGYSKLLKARTSDLAFHPNSIQQVLDVGDGVFGLKRMSQDGKDVLYALHNLTQQQQEISLGESNAQDLIDLLSGAECSSDDPIILSGYSVCWFKVNTTE